MKIYSPAELHETISFISLITPEVLIKSMVFELSISINVGFVTDRVEIFIFFLIPSLFPSDFLSK